MKTTIIIILNIALAIAIIIGLAAANVFYLKLPDPIPTILGAVYGTAHMAIYMAICCSGGD